MNEEFLIANNSSNRELELHEDLFKLLKNSPIPDEEYLQNLPLYINRQSLSRTIFLNELYEKIIDVNGVIMEFGVRWGSNLSTLAVLRGMHEPFNPYRKIIGFDTFEGFPAIDEKDGNDIMIKEGSHGVTSNYEEYLGKIMDYHEKNSPINHIKKYEIIKGDATETLKSYLESNQETIISFAYFDFDIYEPTKVCLELILERLTKGSILAFDELNYWRFPGETLALKEVLGLSKYKIQRGKNSGTVSYIVID
jgi:hypothetical protein